jgi:hypothetical protein
VSVWVNDMAGAANARGPLTVQPARCVVMLDLHEQVSHIVASAQSRAVLWHDPTLHQSPSAMIQLAHPIA